MRDTRMIRGFAGARAAADESADGGEERDGAGGCGGGGRQDGVAAGGGRERDGGGVQNAPNDERGAGAGRNVEGPGESCYGGTYSQPDRSAARSSEDTHSKRDSDSDSEDEERPQSPPLTAQEVARRRRRLDDELRNLTSEDEPHGIEHMTNAQFDAFDRRRRAADIKSRIEQSRLSAKQRSGGRGKERSG